ncbi:MAG: hypothetical protein OXI92_10730 [Acidobacteriota bacterium]|nr:hypothetical protein [Acidobacteriota bacterium]
MATIHHRVVPRVGGRVHGQAQAIGRQQFLQLSQAAPAFHPHHQVLGLVFRDSVQAGGCESQVEAIGRIPEVLAAPGTIGHNGPLLELSRSQQFGDFLGCSRSGGPVGPLPLHGECIQSGGRQGAGEA